MVCTMKIDEKCAFPSIKRFIVLIFCEIEILRLGLYFKYIYVFVCHLVAIDYNPAVLLNFLAAELLTLKTMMVEQKIFSEVFA